MKRVWPFYPVLFGAYTVLSLYSENTALIPPEELPAPLFAVVLATGVLWALLSLVLRSIERGALGASVAVVGFFSYGPIYSQLHDEYGRPTVDRFSMLWDWTAVFILAVIVACWPWKRTARLTKGLNIASAALFAIPTVSIAVSWLQGREIIPATSGGSQAAKYHGPRPDIFYIILDGYGRSDALRRDMNFDNSEFIDGLRKRGFYIADSGHTNYCQTELSLTSSLNMGFLPDVVPKFSAAEEDRRILDRLIDKNRVSLLLRQYGYGYDAVATGFPAVHPRSADLLIESSTGGSLFTSAVLARTPLSQASGVTESMFVSRRKLLTESLEAVGRLGEQASRPRFIFAHILAPHPPFVFGPNGEPTRSFSMFALVDGSHFYQNGGTPAQYEKGYTGQAKTIGRMTLAAIDDLLKREPTPPIVIIQGDHGPKMRYDQEELAHTDINEVFPNLNAYLVPKEVRDALYPTITPVNSFRTIFRVLFGENLPNLPDRSWYSSWTYPFKFQEVTSQIKPKL